jgi:hypothetical protein
MIKSSWPQLELTRVNLQLTVGQSVLVSGPYLGLMANFSFLIHEIIFRQFWVSYYGAPSQTERTGL